MYDIMKKADGAGLAAPQAGLNKRMFVYQNYETGSPECVMINPVILSSEGEIEDWEGCLSFPGVSIKVKRAEKIKVEYQDVDGDIQETEFSGMTARVIQHEIEHLDGIVFTRYLSKLKRDFVNSKMKKVKTRAERRQMGS
jgi:peptide deformylase